MKWHLKGKPYKVQEEAVRRFREHDRSGFGFLMDPGLGKTAVELNCLIDLAMSDRLNAAIGMLPFSIMENWKQEAEKMGFGGKIYLWHDIDGDLSKVRGDLPLVLINFESLITKRCEDFLDDFTKKFGEQKIQGFIDESSRIKNYSSERSKSAMWIGKHSGSQAIMTGSALTKSPLDLWPQLTYLGATNMPPHVFKNFFCKKGGFKGRQIIGAQNEEKLTAMINRYCFVAKKSEWTDLPSKIYQTRNVSMTPKQTEAYRDMMEDFIAIVDGQEFEANLVLSQLSKLQQISCGFIKQGDDEVDICGKNNPRINEVVNILEETPTKTIIFCWHNWCVEKLMKELQDWNPIALRGRSHMKPAQFEENKRRFNEDNSVRVAVVQISAGGIGLTLLGNPGENRCCNTIYFENSFDLEHRIQSEDRNHRHGQDQTVSYYDLISSPIDVKAIAALQRKQMMAETILNPAYWQT